MHKPPVTLAELEDREGTHKLNLVYDMFSFEPRIMIESIYQDSCGRSICLKDVDKLTSDLIVTFLKEEGKL